MARHVAEQEVATGLQAHPQISGCPALVRFERSRLEALNLLLVYRQAIAAKRDAASVLRDDDQLMLVGAGVVHLQLDDSSRHTARRRGYVEVALVDTDHR